MKRCVFFDRDGIVNESPGPGRYVLRPVEFRIQPGFVKVLARVRALGFEAVVATNQRCVALNLLTPEGLARIHDGLRARLRAEHGLELTDILACPHGSEAGCACRKPKPGLLLEAARRHGLDLARSWMIGDSERDVEAGLAAGCRAVLVLADRPPSRATVVVGSLEELDILVAEGGLVL